MNDIEQENQLEAAGNERRKLSIKRTAEYADLRERLQKVLATSGMGARRGLEDRILKGEILVNAEVPEMGLQVKAGDRISVDGRVFIVKLQEGDFGRILIYNKPDGEVTTRHDPEGRKTVFERLPRIKGARWIAVGRLDINTQGLLVFTTNGDLAQKLMHPENEFAREYLCRLHGEVTEEMAAQLLAGVALEDGPASFSEIEPMQSAEGQNEWWRVVIKEGRNREVRRLWEAVGLQVSRLKRSVFGPFSLPKSLHRGEVAELDQADVVTICAEMGIAQNPAQLVAVDESAVRVRRVRESVDGKKKVIATPGGKAESYWTGERGYGGGDARPARSTEFAITDPRGDDKRNNKNRNGKKRFARGQRPATRIPGAPGEAPVASENRRFGQPTRGPRDPNALPRAPRDPNAPPRFARDPNAPPRAPRDPNAPPRFARDPNAQPRAPRDPNAPPRFARDPNAQPREPGLRDANGRGRRRGKGQGAAELGDRQPNFDALGNARARPGAVRGPLGTSEVYFNSESYGNSISHHGAAHDAGAGQSQAQRGRAGPKRVFVGPMDNPIPNFAHQQFDGGNEPNGNFAGPENGQIRPGNERGGNERAGNERSRNERNRQRPKGPRSPNPNPNSEPKTHAAAPVSGVGTGGDSPNQANGPPNGAPGSIPGKNKRRRRRGGRRPDGAPRPDGSPSASPASTAAPNTDS
jgi:23S rRNA pseudouridine2605 synthase